MAEPSGFALRRLTEQPGEPVGDVLRRAADLLRPHLPEATIEVRLAGTRGADVGARYSVQLTPAGATVAPGGTRDAGAPAPTLTFVMTADTFRRITDGSYSPMQAYADGRVRFSGNLEVVPPGAAAPHTCRRPRPSQTLSFDGRGMAPGHGRRRLADVPGCQLHTERHNRSALRLGRGIFRGLRRRRCPRMPHAHAVGAAVRSPSDPS